MVSFLSLARPYAEAVFRLANEAGTLNEWSCALETLALVACDHAAYALIVDSRVSTLQKQQLVCDFLGKEATDPVRRFVGIILENHRFRVLPDIYKLFQEKILEKDGQVQAQIESAFPLEETQIAVLRDALSARLKRTVKTQAVLNPLLIGGVKVTVGDWVMDASVSNQLRSLATCLSEESL